MKHTPQGRDATSRATAVSPVATTVASPVTTAASPVATTAPDDAPGDAPYRGLFMNSSKDSRAASEPEVCHPVLLHPGATVARQALQVDVDGKMRNLKRLRRIEGQVRGLQKMVEDERYCADILTQIASVHEALRSVGRELMRNHLKHCAIGAIRAGEPAASAMYDELVDMMYKHSR